jgi:hypothetical protein
VLRPGPHTRECVVKSWSAIAGFGFIAFGTFCLSLDLPAEISWAPWGCIGGGITLLAAAGLGAILDRHPER